MSSFGDSSTHPCLPPNGGFGGPPIEKKPKPRNRSEQIRTGFQYVLWTLFILGGRTESTIYPFHPLDHPYPTSLTMGPRALIIFAEGMCSPFYPPRPSSIAFLSILNPPGSDEVRGIQHTGRCAAKKAFARGVVGPGFGGQAKRGGDRMREGRGYCAVMWEGGL